MSAAAILSRLADAGVRVEVRGDRLALDAVAPPPPDLLDELRQHRTEVIDFLAAEAARDEAEEAAAIAADAGAPLPDPGTPDRQRLDHDHAQAVAGLLEAARKRPPSWADPASPPGTGTLCACCQGTRWWSDARGWRCAICHPLPETYRPEDAVHHLNTSIRSAS